MTSSSKTLESCICLVFLFCLTHGLFERKERVYMLDVWFEKENIFTANDPQLEINCFSPEIHFKMIETSFPLHKRQN